MTGQVHPGHRWYCPGWNHVALGCGHLQVITSCRAYLSTRVRVMCRVAGRVGSA